MTFAVASRRGRAPHGLARSSHNGGTGGFPVQTPVLVPADVAFMLVATALVLLMTPALAFFYGGLVRSKNALNTMMMSFISLGFVAVAWAVIGYSLAFAPGNNFIGDLSRLFLNGVGLEPNGTIPHY